MIISASRFLVSATLSQCISVLRPLFAGLWPTSTLRRKCRWLLLLLTLFVCSPLAHAIPHLPKPFVATYESDFLGFKLSATRSLTKLNNGSYKLRFFTSSWFGSLEESSVFNWSETGTIIPLHYEYRRKGLGRDRNAELSFDHQQHIVINDVQNKPWQLSIPANTQDKLSYQLQLRSDLLNNNVTADTLYQVADGGHLKEYGFEIIGPEKLSTPIGKLNTLKVKRIRDHDQRRVTYLWFAIDMDHLLVRVQQQEKDGKEYEINLVNVTMTDQN